MESLPSTLRFRALLATLILTAQYVTPLTNSAAASPATPPKLILQITVDQLRGDLPTRYYERLGKGGFRYLWEKGVVYTNAHHDHANTETIVGHATLATGAHPAVHGMIGNLWFDRSSQRSVYNIEDASYQLLSENAGVNSDTEIDPTQATAKTDGRSPRTLLATTFGDELRSHSGGKAKVFGVSVKDRGAVSMAGHTGKAFWFSKASGGFVTSNYYYDRYPQWVLDWNQKQLPQRYLTTPWQLSKPKKSYLFGDSDDRPWEVDLAGFGRAFPHDYRKAPTKYFTTLLTISPAGDEITLDFAKALLQAEQLGQDTITDYLSISFSSTDYVGHVFGPSSLEAEDNILRLDRTLADLFSFIDKHIGLAHTLIVLSADHGGADTPGYLHTQQIPAAYIDHNLWDEKGAIAAIKKQFNIKGTLIEKRVHPYIYLSNEVKRNPRIDQLALERAVTEAYQQFPGVAHAISSQQIATGQLPDSPLMRKVSHNYHPDRSGDIYLVYDSHHFVNDFDGLTVASSHGSPWTYDTYVPIVFAGAKLKAAQVTRRVYTVDIAPTLSAFIRAKPPSGANGQVLEEVMQHR